MVAAEKDLRERVSNLEQLVVVQQAQMEALASCVTKLAEAIRIHSDALVAVSLWPDEPSKPRRWRLW